MLLQVLDDGALTDSLERDVNFENTMIIVKWTFGVPDERQGASLGFRQEQRRKRSSAA